MASLDEGGSDKKVMDILDLSLIEISCKSDLKKLLERIPDYKVRPEKVREEEISIEDGNYAENLTDTSDKVDYQFANPIPVSLRDVCLKELGRVNISWRMLTVSRPKSKLEEDFFTRMVQLEKLQYKTIHWEFEKEALKNRKGMATSRSRTAGRPAFKSGFNVKSSVTETRLITCKECGIEFCYGTCNKFLYDDSARTFNPVTADIFDIQRKTANKSKKGATKQSSFSQDVENHHPEVMSPDGGEKLDDVEIKPCITKQNLSVPSEGPVKVKAKSKVSCKVKLRKSKKTK
ncbi:hypothetical protein CHUAL_011759 [Chamberlinius hualienensis]